MISRQSFLGLDSDARLKRAKVAIVGLGGGGSHIAQQLAHIGIGRLILIDHDNIDQEGTNLNRLVGGTRTDVRLGTSKVLVAARLILGINPGTDVLPIQKHWHEGVDALRDCDVIVGCIDTFRGRQELEREARRFHIPYIDIGIDVYAVDNGFMISGQVFLSLPGEQCMTCFNLLRDDLLAQESIEYGAAGPRQQVIWPNGVLASSAVGLVVSLFTPWHETNTAAILLEYDGNIGTVSQSSRMEALRHHECTHFVEYDDLGDPLFTLEKGYCAPQTRFDRHQS